MTDDLDIPKAAARLEKGPAAWSWVVDRCPHCGQRHTHGGGPLDGDPRELLGHRAAHCREGSYNAGYMLGEAEND